MPRRAIGRKPKNLAVIRKPRDESDRERIEAQHDALELTAKWAGFVNYQQMTVHIWNRITAQTADTIDGYRVVDTAIREIAERVRATASRRMGG